VPGDVQQALDSVVGHVQLLALLQLPHVAVVEEVVDAVWRQASARRRSDGAGAVEPRQDGAVQLGHRWWTLTEQSSVWGISTHLRICALVCL
jgi:hypothetical protein